MNTKLTSAQMQSLAQAAAQAKQFSYSPYSHFKVGAAVWTEDGKIYTGTNIENVSYGLTVCAERNALFKAVGEGYRRVVALAVCTDPISGQAFGTPCGACLQVMTEFMSPQAPLILVAQHSDGSIQTEEKQLHDFLPYVFSKFGK